MNHLSGISRIAPAAAGAALALVAAPATAETVPWDEMRVLIEINATDGDAGFHALVDGDAWKEVTLNGSKLFNAVAKGPLRETLGLTEIFFESDEPPCDASVADDPEDVVTLREILEAFPAGTYTFSGKTIEPGDQLLGSTELTHAIPAAPDISAFDESEDVDPNDTVISWAAGSDIGECPFEALVNDGIIPDPATVPLAFWEVVVEPEDEEGLPGPLRVWSAQVPSGTTSIQVSPEYLNAYAGEGVTEFKFEVGAVEARTINGTVTKGNQTFSEGTFELDD